MLGDDFMRDLKDAPPEEVARRMRDLAAGLTDPADIAAAEAYAKELERAAAKERSAFKLDSEPD